MQASFPASFLKLWDLAGGHPAAPASDDNYFYERSGFYLLAPPRNFGYWCTPVNSLTFAHTGGDGVHFGFVLRDGKIAEDSPVVMTVPCSDTPNHIVGSSLVEFLSLGCRFGYFQLEQLQHNRDETVAELELQRFRPGMDEVERRVLDQLVREFGLVPWSNPGKRLLELKGAFEGELVVTPLEQHDS